MSTATPRVVEASFEIVGEPTTGQKYAAVTLNCNSGGDTVEALRLHLGPHDVDRMIATLRGVVDTIDELQPAPA
jgi:hypothetical protein